MLTSHIPKGKLVHIKTIGSPDRHKAPALDLVGFFNEETSRHFKDGCITISNDGMKAVQNDDGRVIGYEKGVKVQTIPRRNIKSIDVVSVSY